MKRILYIHHGGAIGGAPMSLLYLLRHLDRSRYEPVVVVLRHGPAADLYRAEGIETYVEPRIRDFSHTTLEWYGGRDLWRLPGRLLSLIPSIWRTRALIRRLRPDLVHLNSSVLAPCAIACRREGVPLVWHIREPLAHGYLGLRRAWLRRTVDRCASRVVAISRHDAEQLILGERVRVIYNFVDFSEFDRTLSGEAVRAEFAIPPDAPLVLMLGGVSPPKGTLTLVRALPALVGAVPDVRVVIAGPPLPPESSAWRGIAKRLLGADAYGQAMRQAVEALPQAARAALIFAGVRQDVPHLLAASQVLVFPSTVPHFARPIIEAAAMGVPSVASDLGGPRELIQHGKTGLLIPPNDAEALAEALADLLCNPARAHALGEAAYEQARRLFDAQTNAAATVALYDEILGSPA